MLFYTSDNISYQCVGCSIHVFHIFITVEHRSAPQAIHTCQSLTQPEYTNKPGISHSTSWYLYGLRKELAIQPYLLDPAWAESPFSHLVCPSVCLPQILFWAYTAEDLFYVCLHNLSNKIMKADEKGSPQTEFKYFLHTDIELAETSLKMTSWRWAVRRSGLTFNNY